ncbi:MAG: hypothetical protein JJE21_03120 [Spirochaetaceae bacterium]|nr:hypothetical protein [Spirochaetaceae bacterium]
MMQLWLITLLYLTYTGLIFISPSLGIYNPTLLRIRDYLFNHEKYIILIMIIGYALTILTLFFPISPGPTFLGDLLVSAFLFFSAINFTFILVKKELSIVIDENIITRHRNYAIIIFIVALLHFVFPAWVIL